MIGNIDYYYLIKSTCYPLLISIKSLTKIKDYPKRYKNLSLAYIYYRFLLIFRQFLLRVSISDLSYKRLFNYLD